MIQACTSTTARHWAGVLLTAMVLSCSEADSAALLLLEFRPTDTSVVFITYSCYPGPRGGPEAMVPAVLLSQEWLLGWWLPQKSPLLEGGGRAGEGGVDTARCPLSRISRRPTPIRGLIPPCARTRLRCAPTLAQRQKQAIPADTLGVQGPGMHGAGLPGIDKVFPLASESGGVGREKNVCVCSRGFCILEMQSRLRAGSRAGM